MADWSDWIGREQRADDRLDPALAARWCATFDGSFASEDGARLLERAGHDPWGALEALEGCGLLDLDPGPRLRMLRPLRAFVLEHTEREGCRQELARVLAERGREEVEHARTRAAALRTASTMSLGTVPIVMIAVFGTLAVLFLMIVLIYLYWRNRMARGR